MISPITAWRNYKQLYSLTGCRCVECNKLFYPKKYLCGCGSTQFVEHELSGKGKLVTFTCVHNPAEEFKLIAPYYLGIVEMDGVKVLGQIVDSPYIGMPVKAVFRKLYEGGTSGVVSYGIKFVEDGP